MQEKTLASTQIYVDPTSADHAACHSGIMWSAIFGGVLAMTIVMLLLLSLASAFGFASLSPWGNHAAAVGKTFAISGALALIVIQWLAAAFGGYMTGRMRTAYRGAHTHEVFFRDTAHGFLTWALATLIGVVFLASAVMQAHAGEGDYGRRDTTSISMHYVDRLFTTPEHDANPTDQDREEAAYVLRLAVAGGSVPEEDRASLVQLIAARTHMAEGDAQHRIDNVIAEEKSDADSARKYAAVSSLFLFFSMMIGAFVASVAGGLGGQHRDLHYTTGRLEG